MHWWLTNTIRLVVPINSQSADDMDRRRSVDHRGKLWNHFALTWDAGCMLYHLNASRIMHAGGAARKYEGRV